jgi:hypothetical protein
LATSIDGCCLAAQLANFAEDADGLVGELFEVGSGDTGGCFRHDGEGFVLEVCVVCVVFVIYVWFMEWRAFGGRREDV